MSKRSFDGCIGRSVILAERMHPDKRYSMNEAASHLMAMGDAEPYLEHFRFEAAMNAVRKFLYSKKRVGRVNGFSLNDLPMFLCGPGNRWGRSVEFNRDELIAVVARRRKQQKGFDPECEALERIIDVMPDAKTFMGDVLA